MKAQLLEMKTGKELLLHKGRVTIGRNKENDIVINDPYVSRRHCHILGRDNKFFIEDLDTMNGTFLNFEKLHATEELRNNDVIVLYKNGPKFKFKIIKSKINFFEGLKSILINKISIFFILLMIIFSGGFVSSIMIIKNKPRKNNNLDFTIRKRLENVLLKYGEKNAHIDQKAIERIEYYIASYKNKNLNSFLVGMERRRHYIYMIEKVFSEHKIPADLSYLAFVESYYDPKAYNKISGARGMWQVMPDTARQYGLRVDYKSDERIDAVKSTKAAASYISDLIAVFGINSFTLAIAAYNVGDGSILNSLKKIDDPVNNRNFWYLYKNNLIPDETKEYVLKVLALIILTEDYENENSLVLK